MPRDIDLLVHDCAHDLRGHSHRVHSGARPEHPVCIIYLGNRSASFHHGLSDSLALSWGANADAILYFTAQSPELSSIHIPNDGAELSENELLMHLSRLLKSSKKFENAAQISLYAVFDTDQTDTAEQFVTWYNFIGDLRRVFDRENLTIRSMLILVANQELGLTEKVRTIKNALYDQYVKAEVGGSNAHLYDSLFVLSNRRSDGTFAFFDANSEEYAADRILANIIMLSNNGGFEYQQARQRLWSSTTPAYTVAYNYKEKPIKEIVLAILQRVVSLLADSVVMHHTYGSLQDPLSLNAAALSEAVGMKTNFGVVEQFWKSLEGYLPDDSFLAYLPNVRGLTLDDSFSTWNECTLNCLEAFLVENHDKMATDAIESQLPTVLEQINNALSRKFISPDLRRGFSRDVISEFSSDALLKYPFNGMQKVRGAIEYRCKRRFVEAYCRLMEDALEVSKQQAESLMDEFESVKGAIETNAAAEFYGANDDVREFYADKARSYLLGANRLSELRKEVFRLGQNREGMLGALRRILSQLFTDDAIFQQPYLEELSARLGAKAAEKQEEVTKELMGNMGDKLSFYFHSVLPIKRLVLEAYLFSTTGEDTLYRLLSERESEMGVHKILHNTSNGDCVESIWVYSLEKESLLESA